MSVHRPRIGLCLIVIIGALLAGCIRPDEVEQPVATPTLPSAPAVEPLEAPVPTLSSGEPVSPPLAVDPLTLIAQFIQRRGDVPSNITIWTDQRLEPDQLQAFTYSGAAGEPCAGFLLSAVPGTPSDNGAVACAEDLAAGAFAGVTLFLTSDGQPYSIVFGQVFDPTVSAITVIYTDGSSASAPPVQGGYVLVTPGIAEVSAIIGVDPAGNTVIPNVPQSAVR